MGVTGGETVAGAARVDRMGSQNDTLRKVYVEATGCCNLQCAMCPRVLWAATSDHMAPDCYDALLSGLPEAPDDTVTLAFGGFGEPTIHPDFVRMVALARAAGRRVELITNGTTLTPALASDLVALDVAQVTVSVDGGNDPSYAAVRGRPISTVLDATAVLCEERNRCESPMAIGMACVATRSNVGSVPGLLDTARQLELDFVSIGNIVPHTLEMAADALWQHAAQVSGSHPARMRPRVVMGRFDYIDETRPLVEHLWTQLRVVPPPALDSGAWHNHCRFAHEGMVAVAWDGHVAPCLSLLYTHPEFIGDREKLIRAYSVGQVTARPIADIWREVDYCAFRDRVREFDFSPCLSCNGCALSETNDGDCFGTAFPACGECLWAQGIAICP